MLTTGLLETVFGVHASVVIDPVTGTPVAIPYAVVGADEPGEAQVSSHPCPGRT